LSSQKKKKFKVKKKHCQANTTTENCIRESCRAGEFGIQADWNMAAKLLAMLNSSL